MLMPEVRISSVSSTRQSAYLPEVIVPAAAEMLRGLQLSLKFIMQNSNDPPDMVKYLENIDLRVPAAAAAPCSSAANH